MSGSVGRCEWQRSAFAIGRVRYAENVAKETKSESLDQSGVCSDIAHYQCCRWFPAFMFVGYTLSYL